VAKCSDGLSTWDGNKCVKCEETQFSKENKCTEQCADNKLEPYWDPLKKKCVACSFKWEEIRGKICFEKCKGHSYNEATDKCDGCFDYWMKKENDRCVNRCSKDKAYDRVKRNRCIDIYDIFEENVNELKKNLQND
jgi:hypothetical protein